VSSNMFFFMSMSEWQAIKWWNTKLLPLPV
jgi:hypothetical protein